MRDTEFTLESDARLLDRRLKNKDFWINQRPRRRFQPKHVDFCQHGARDFEDPAPGAVYRPEAGYIRLAHEP
jgi:hypothetical protein